MKLRGNSLDFKENLNSNVEESPKSPYLAIELDLPKSYS